VYPLQLSAKELQILQTLRDADLYEANLQNIRALMQSELIINTYARQTTSLDEKKDILIAPFKPGCAGIHWPSQFNPISASP
jgi:hypothetical protein